MSSSRFILPFAAAVVAALSLSSNALGQPAPIDDALDRIDAASLKGHLSFIASDLLKGRDTPSTGLDIAAEYIAAQFRRAKLEVPAATDDGYFQTASVEADDPATAAFSCTVTLGDDTVEIPESRISVMAANDDVTVENARPLPVAFPIEEVTTATQGSTVLITSFPSPQSISRDEMREFFGEFRTLLEEAERLNAVAILNLDPESESGTGPGQRSRFGRMSSLPIFTVHGRDLASKLGYDFDQQAVSARVIESRDRIELSYTAPTHSKVPVRNVVGLLRGSDPELADTYILVTAHYDHIGEGAAVDGDSIYNGANDDGSGTVSVIEIASALASLEARPKRSIIFMCVYGEERGLLGSRHYVENPLVPLEKSIANINLEHVGRTDDSEGDSIRRVMPTGFDFTTISEVLIDAGDDTGIEVMHHPRNSDSFFSRSDNIAFANAGIPCTTICTAFIFPDYHGAGDHWQHIDFENMAAVNRMIALALWRLAESDTEPTWNKDHRRTGRYVEAWNELKSNESRDE